LILGLDLGGTHSDGVLIQNNQIKAQAKIPTLPQDIKTTIINLASHLMKNHSPELIQKIVLSSTLVTNLLSKKENQPAGIFLISGAGASLQQITSSIPYAYLSASGSVDHRGKVVTPLNQDDLLKAQEFFEQKKVKNIAIVSKFSTRNPLLEQQGADFFKKQGFNTFLGSHFSGKLNFPRRCFTTWLSASINYDFQQSLKDIERGLKDLGLKGSLYILKADGGAIAFKEALKNPLESALSGPAAGMLGSLYNTPFFGDALTLDIGGTTTELGFLVKGWPLLEPQGITLLGFPTLIRALKVYSLPLGGDSWFSFDNNNQVEIKNQRKGLPYCFGGPIPTLTDILRALEEKEAKALEGLKDFSPPQIEQVAQKMGEFLNNTLKEYVFQINQGPIYTVNEFFHRRQFNPKTIILSGGAAPFFVSLLKKATGLEVILAPNYAFCNALGAAFSKVTAEINLFANTADGVLLIPELQEKQNISHHFSLSDAKILAQEKLKTLAYQKGITHHPEIEITEASVFNMVRGFSTSGKNIRVKAQIKPGLAEVKNGS